MTSLPATSLDRQQLMVRIRGCLGACSSLRHGLREEDRERRETARDIEREKKDIKSHWLDIIHMIKKNWCIVRCFVTNVPHKALRFLLLFIFGFGDI
jgi:hypothetical protein